MCKNDGLGFQIIPCKMMFTKEIEIHLLGYFDRLVGETIHFNFDGVDISQYVKDYFRVESIAFCKSKVGQFDNWNKRSKERLSSHTKEEMFKRYLRTCMKNLMRLNKQRMIKEESFRNEVLKQYYREQKLNILLDV